MPFAPPSNYLSRCRLPSTYLITHLGVIDWDGGRIWIWPGLNERWPLLATVTIVAQPHPLVSTNWRMANLHGQHFHRLPEMNQLANWVLFSKQNVDHTHQRPKACQRHLGGDDLEDSVNGLSVIWCMMMLGVWQIQQSTVLWFGFGSVVWPVVSWCLGSVTILEIEICLDRLISTLVVTSRD